MSHLRTLAIPLCEYCGREKDHSPLGYKCHCNAAEEAKMISAQANRDRKIAEGWAEKDTLNDILEESK